MAVRDWRVDPGSCNGGSTTWPAVRDVRTTVTLFSPWGLPLARDAVTCGGAGWHRDADFVHYAHPALEALPGSAFAAPPFAPAPFAAAPFTTDPAFAWPLTQFRLPPFG